MVILTLYIHFWFYWPISFLICWSIGIWLLSLVFVFLLWWRMFRGRMTNWSASIRILSMLRMAMKNLSSVILPLKIQLNRHMKLCNIFPFSDHDSRVPNGFPNCSMLNTFKTQSYWFRRNILRKEAVRKYDNSRMTNIGPSYSSGNLLPTSNDTVIVVLFVHHSRRVFDVIFVVETKYRFFPPGMKCDNGTLVWNNNSFSFMMTWAYRRK